MAHLIKISEALRAHSDCTTCHGMGWVCENDGKPWGGLCCDAGASTVCEHGACGCGAGDPCLRCNPDPPLSGGFASIDPRVYGRPLDLDIVREIGRMNAGD